MTVESFRASGVLGLSVPSDIAKRRREERILDAMAETVAEKTFAETTIADIVGRIHISRATFYKHYPNKKVCVQAALDSFVAELQQAAEDAVCADDPPPETIFKGAAALLDTLAAKPAYAKLTLIEAVVVSPQTIERCRRLLTTVLKAQWLGDLPSGVDAETRAAFGRAHVLLCHQILDCGAEQLPKLLPDIVYIALLPFTGPAEALRRAQDERAGSVGE